MKHFISILLVCSSIFGGALVGRLWATTKCDECYITADQLPTGQFRENKCCLGYCKGSSSLSECYRESCKGCTDRDGTKCPSAINFTCPAEGNCVNGVPRAPALCTNACHC
jgi:hypothetical protein